MAKKVYIYNDWHNGDIITNRCLVKVLLNHDVDITLGSHRNRRYLVEDLPVNHVISPWEENAPHSPSLSQLCPSDCCPINSWCGTFPDIDAQHHHNWAGIVKTWNRQSSTHDIGIFLSEKETPMIDFDFPYKIKTRGRAIYVETGPTRSPHCHFHFNMEKLGNLFPGFNFYCTADTGCRLDNVISCSNRNLIELSFISNTCEAIVGKGSGPFLCTYTEINRKKPRAVVGFNAPEFWHYRDNPLKYLNNEEDLINFLQNVYNNPWEIV